MKIIILAVAVILIILSFFIINKYYLTGNAVKENNFYTYTTAICNTSNFCQDYVITCKGNKTISKKSITGASVQNNPEWKDSRKTKELCKIFENNSK